MKVAMYLAIGVLALAAAAVGAWVYVAMSVEEPPFALVEKDGAFELRDYPALTVAETVQPGERDAAARSGFRALAAYIFAKDRPGETIAMTAPVTQSRDAASGGWRVRFVMPAGRRVEDLPIPGGEAVRLATTPAARYAAVRFSGAWDLERFADQERALRAWAAARGVALREAATFAFYNDPFTPPLLRRNEILIETALP